MSIEIPVTIPLGRPIKRPESPFRKCTCCEYVSTYLVQEGMCPRCQQSLPGGGNPWPEPTLVELWDDVVFAYNHERPEIAAVASAMYFEASVFELIYFGTVWLDPERNWLGAAFEEVKDKETHIWRHLLAIRSPSETQEELKRIFGLDGKGMLEKVAKGDATAFWENYLHLAELRNRIVHKGLRLSYRTVDLVQDKRIPEEVMRASIHFVPECWVVFSRLWNEYISKPMLAKRKKDGPEVPLGGELI